MSSVPQDIVCIDASLAAKLVMPEEDSEAATTLWQNWQAAGIRVIAPSLITWEVANSIRKTVRRGRLPRDVADGIFEVFLGLQITTSVYNALPMAAWRDFVLTFDHLVTPYDAGYLYVAEILGCDFWTADDRLVRTVGDDLPWVRSLSEVADHRPQ